MEEKKNNMNLVDTIIKGLSEVLPYFSKDAIEEVKNKVIILCDELIQKKEIE